MKVEASAPSNIALIKYMGKTDSKSNLPSNPSLSYTLEHLRSFVTLESCEGEDQWQPLEKSFELSAHGREKFLNHFRRLKSEFAITGSYLIKSANNFPADCGLASSASSFAALTLAAASLCKTPPSKSELSRLSRLGSGSSCRSIFSPWAVWRGEGAEAVDLDLRLEHAVILSGESKKDVSSSEAHRRVPTSLLFAGRSERATKRLEQVLAALSKKDWTAAFEITWGEFWDMHALFETSQPSFGYLNSESLRTLNTVREWWKETGDGPLVTMDAGPNVHLLLRANQVEEAQRRLHGFKMITSWKGLVHERL